jgi:hypothetical protein
MYLCENPGLGFGMCHKLSVGFQNVVFSDVPLCSLVVCCHCLAVTDPFTCKVKKQRVGYETGMWQEQCLFILHFCYFQITTKHTFKTHTFYVMFCNRKICCRILHTCDMLTIVFNHILKLKHWKTQGHVNMLEHLSHNISYINVQCQVVIWSIISCLLLVQHYY